MLYDILGAIMTSIQVVTLLAVLVIFFAVGPFAMLYLMSEGFRDFWLDYESWLDRKIARRRIKKRFKEYGPHTGLVTYAAQDITLTTMFYNNLTTTETEDADPSK